MARSAVRAPRWSRTTAGFTADLALYLVIGLVFWTLLPMLVLGWAPVLITSGSMSPAVEPGDVLLVQRGVPEGEWFVPGTIITYEGSRPAVAAGTGPDDQRLVTHRVDRIADDGTYVTRGDANAAADPQPVDPEQVVGAARLLVPYLGLPVHWARDGRLLQLSLVAAAFVLVVLASRLDEEDARRRTAREARRRTAPHRGLGHDPATLGALAARAARAGAASGRPQPPRDGSDAEATTPRRVTGLTRGLPPAGALLGIAALTLGTAVPTSEAAFTASSSSTGNHFATAPADDPGDGDDDGQDPDDDDLVRVDVEIVDEWGSGYCADVTVGTSSPTPIVWEVDLDLTTFPLDGQVADIWSVEWSFDDGVLHATGLGYNDTVADGSEVGWGFCANRPAGSIPTTSLAIPLAEADGEPIVDGGVGQGSTVTFDLTLDDDLYLVGQAIAHLWVRSNHPGHSQATVTLYADDDELATGGVWDIEGEGWRYVEAPLWPGIIDTFAAGTALRVEITLIRLDMEVDGPSSLAVTGN